MALQGLNYNVGGQQPQGGGGSEGSRREAEAVEEELEGVVDEAERGSVA